MAGQIYAGNFVNTRALLSEGHVATNKAGIPLGWCVNHGLKKFRWAHIQTAVARLPGTVVGHATASAYGPAVNIPAGYFTSVVGAPGGAKGSYEFELFSAIGIFSGGDTNQNYADGELAILSGSGGGAGRSYRIVRYDPGIAGKRTKVVLGEPLQNTLSADMSAAIFLNDYKRLIPCSAAIHSVSPVGFLTASCLTSGYQWIQTRGPGVGIALSNCTLNAPLAAGVNGTVQLMSAGGALLPLQQIARAKDTGVATSFVAIDICIE